MIQTTIFDMLYPKFTINKPIRLIEFFAGYGSQALALKYLDAEFEHWKTCEWAIKSIQAYKDIHFTDDETDYSKDYTKDELIEYLFKKGVSSNYNEPMTLEQIKRLSERQIRTTFNNIQITHNLVNIQQVKGKDLDIVDTDKYTYMLTYSFPCQDLSNAGLKKGMSDTSTRSGMLWEVERILTECYDLKQLPQILIMENVPQVHGEGNTDDFNKWQFRLEELGYKNYWEDLIATDYGIPQTRNRCFMVSILGEYSYAFPPREELKTKLKDLLEKNVDERYYLSDKMINYITSKDDKYIVNENKLVINRDIACAKTTREGNTRADASDYISEDVGENFNLKKVNIMCDDLLLQDKVKENDTLLTNFITRRIKENDIIQNNNITPTLTTSATEIGVCVNDVIGTYDFSSSDAFLNGKDRFEEDKGTFPTLRTQPKDGIVNSNLRIRRLTPRECFRLMGIKDADFENCARHQSDASMYHLAGDSIVVNVLKALMKGLF